MLQLVSNSTQTNHNSPFNSAAFKAELAIQFKRVQDIANDVTSSNSINGTILLEQMKKHLEDNNNIITLPIKSISPIDAFNTFSKTNSALMDYSNYYSMAMSNVTYILSH
jgi:hypothetical protein